MSKDRTNKQSMSYSKQPEKVMKKYEDDMTPESWHQHGEGACSLPPYGEAPPPYSAAAPSTSVSEAKPPPYMQQDSAVLLGELKAQLNSDPEERCSTCFDPIHADKAEGFSGNVLWQGLKAYHSECYLKSKGPKCEHCCFALIPYPDRGLSGRWGLYDGRRYHEECYVLYAGPRCSRCFDVITANSNEGFSGLWVQEGNKQYHEECYRMKVQALVNAKKA